MSSQRIAIALPIEDNLLTSLHHWGENFDFSHVESVTFIHIVKQNVAPLEFGLIETPDESTYRDMVPTLRRFLQDEARKILPESFLGKIDFKLAKDFNPEEEIVEILKTIQATLVIVATRGKHGLDRLFHSSFTDYMIKHAPCDVLVVKPEDQVLKRSA